MRNRDEKVDTRDEILRVASRLFARSGYKGTSTREIARGVGIQQPSLFNHFLSKREILEVLLAYSIDPATKAAIRYAHADGSAAERLYRLIYEDTTYLCTSPYDLTGVHVREVMDDAAFIGWKRRLDRLHDATEAIIRQGVDGGDFRAVEPKFARQMISAMNIVNIERYSGSQPRSVHQTAAESADFILSALLAEPDRLGQIRSQAMS